MFADKERVAARNAELEAIGIHATARWPLENAPHTATINDFPDEYFRETAVFDVEDILAADKVILTVPSDTMLIDAAGRSISRGGRHFESGFVYGLVYAQAKLKADTKPRELLLLGKRENVFHFLDGLSVTADYPAIRAFETWEELKEALVKELNVSSKRDFAHSA